MTQAIREQFYKECIGYADELISQFDYHLKLENIVRHVIERWKIEHKTKIIPVTAQTLKKHINNHLVNISYYSYEASSRDYVVYGIFNNGELDYIGKTIRGLEVRRNEHIKNEKEPWVTEDSFFVVLARENNDFDLQYTENQLIRTLQPKYNIITTYEFKSREAKQEFENIQTGYKVFKEFILKREGQLTSFIEFLLKIRMYLKIEKGIVDLELDKELLDDLIEDMLQQAFNKQ